jgi:hypothetical protein
LPFIQAGGEFNASLFCWPGQLHKPAWHNSRWLRRQIYGLVQIPGEAWFIGFDLSWQAPSFLRFGRTDHGDVNAPPLKTR